MKKAEISIGVDISAPIDYKVDTSHPCNHLLDIKYQL